AAGADAEHDEAAGDRDCEHHEDPLRVVAETVEEERLLDALRGRAARPPRWRRGRCRALPALGRGTCHFEREAYRAATATVPQSTVSPVARSRSRVARSQRAPARPAS